MIVENSLVEKSPDLLMTEIENEAVILSIESGRYIGLNKMGTEIWSRLSEIVRVSELISNLSELFEEDKIIIEEHVLEFLNELLKKSLIKVVNEDYK